MKLFTTLNRIIGIAVIACALNSCFNYVNTESYTLVANFEYGSDLTVRPDSTYYAEKGIGIGYNYLAFCHNIDPSTYDFLGGFRISILKGLYGTQTGDKTLDMTWRAHCLPATNTYMVYQITDRRPEADIQFLMSTVGTCSMRSCQVTNTAKVAEEIAAKFQRGDKLTLIATGYKDNQMTGKAEIELADYTQNDKAGQPKDSIVSSWTNFDLSTLKQVDKINFALVSNVSVPLYFCLDNVVADISLEY